MIRKVLAPGAHLEAVPRAERQALGQGHAGLYAHEVRQVGAACEARLGHGGAWLGGGTGHWHPHIGDLGSTAEGTKVLGM